MLQKNLRVVHWWKINPICYPRVCRGFSILLKWKDWPGLSIVIISPSQHHPHHSNMRATLLFVFSLFVFSLFVPLSLCDITTWHIGGLAVGSWGPNFTAADDPYSLAQFMNFAILYINNYSSILPPNVKIQMTCIHLKKKTSAVIFFSSFPSNLDFFR